MKGISITIFGSCFSRLTRRQSCFNSTIKHGHTLTWNRNCARLVLPPLGKRYHNTIDETSWAAEDLKKKGEKLSPAPEEIIVVDDHYYRNPSDKVKSLSHQILMLNVIEIQQLLNIMQERLGFTDEQVYMSTGVNRHGKDFSHIDAMGGGNVAAGGGADAAAAAPKAKAEDAAAPVAEKTSFTLKLGAVDAKAKIKVIKEVRTITNLGLKEAKELVEKAPVVLKEGLKKDEIENFKKLLTEAGATVEVL